MAKKTDPKTEDETKTKKEKEPNPKKEKPVKEPKPKKEKTEKEPKPKKEKKPKTDYLKKGKDFFKKDNLKRYTKKQYWKDKKQYYREHVFVEPLLSDSIKATAKTGGSILFTTAKELLHCQQHLWLMALAEFLAMTLLIYLGIMSKCSTLDRYMPSIDRQALAWGFTVASLTLVINPISGGHLNPAVTAGLILSGDCNLSTAFALIIMQYAGAVCGIMALKMTIPYPHIGNYGMLYHNTNLTPEYGFYVEMFATVPLVMLFASLKDRERVDFRGSGALAIGLYYVAAHASFWYHTGAGLNPARAFASLYITQSFENQWVYCAGPYAGAAIGGIMYRVFVKCDKAVLEAQKKKLKEIQKGRLDSKLQFDCFGGTSKPKKDPKPKPEPKKKPDPKQAAAAPPAVTSNEDVGGRRNRRKQKSAVEEPASAEDEDEGKKKKKSKTAMDITASPEEETGKKKKKSKKDEE